MPIKKLKISDFRVPVTFQQYVEQDATRYETAGQYITAYEDRCKFESLGGLDRNRGEQALNQRTHKLYTRYRSDADPTYRVHVDNRFFKVTGFNVVDVGKNQYLEYILDEEKKDIT